MSAEEFLLLGAGVGVVGWTGTAVVELAGIPRGGVVVLGLWAVLVAVMVGAGLLATSDGVRFSLPLLGWGVLNTVAIAVTVSAVALGGSSDTVWTIWAADLTLGYAWTARAFLNRHQRRRAVTYGVAALLGIGLLLVHSANPGKLQPVRYLALAVLHAVPLALESRRSLGTSTKVAALTGAVVGVLAVGWLV